MTNKNPFDFADLSDLPEELAGKLNSDNTANAKVYAEIVNKGADAGYAELDINQIMAAGIRMGIDVPTQQTVRGYLNKAVELKLIQKPSRQTYGALMDAAPAKPKRTKSEDTGLTDAVATAEVPAADADPLASL